MPTFDERQHFRRSGLLGTEIEVIVDGAGSTGHAGAVARRCFDEIERLQAVFNMFDANSEVRRWQRGETTPGRELAAVTDLAAAWRRRTGGAFDPAIGGLMQLWGADRAEGESPTTEEIQRTLDGMRIDGRRNWNLNAIAKGWIVDRAAELAFAPGTLSGLAVNAGGDLRVLGAAEFTVGIEDPRRPYDNVPPLSKVRFGAAALATSGTTRRGWFVDGTWRGHVMDPRIGWPVSHVESASVIAAEAATADVMATVLTVLPVWEGLRFAACRGIACLLVDASGEPHRNDAWRRAEESGWDFGQSQRALSSLSGSGRTVAAEQ